MPFTVPALPYSFDALEPYIDAKTMEIHHDKHHGAYVTNLNKALEGHPDLRRILLYDSFLGYPLRKDYPYQRRQPIIEEVDPITHPLSPSR